VSCASGGIVGSLRYTPCPVTSGVGCSTRCSRPGYRRPSADNRPAACDSATPKVEQRSLAVYEALAGGGNG